MSPPDGVAPERPAETHLGHAQQAHPEERHRQRKTAVVGVQRRSNLTMHRVNQARGETAPWARDSHLRCKRARRQAELLMRAVAACVRRTNRGSREHRAAEDDQARAARRPLPARFATRLSGLHLVIENGGQEG